MQLLPDRIEVTGDPAGTAPLTGAGTVHVGPLAVTVDPVDPPDGAAVRWSVANRGDAPVAVRGVSLVLRLVDVVGPLRMLRNGYQSWSPCGVATFGVDHDPSLDNTSGIELLSAVHHADQRVARPEELRSEAVTALTDDRGPAWVVGFEAGTAHDGTLRLRQGPSGPELWCEAFLGGAVLGATNKMFWSEYHQQVMDLAIDLLGMDGQVLTGDPSVEEAVPGYGARRTNDRYPASVLQSSFFFSRSETIWGGTSQIQRNIVGERVLGLPKEPKPPEERSAARATAPAG